MSLNLSTRIIKKDEIKSEITKKKKKLHKMSVEILINKIWIL